MINLFKKYFASISFNGSYKNWESASLKSTGYDNETFISKLKYKVIKVINGEFEYERDTILFKDKYYSPNFLHVLLLLKDFNNEYPKILDFGGSLGSKYLQHKDLFQNKKFEWSIVEQNKIVEIGNEIFKGFDIKFFNNIEDSLNYFYPNILLINSVLQYIENPKELLNKLLEKTPKIVLLERTFFSKDKTHIKIQKISSRIYKNSYPCWIFNMEDLIEIFNLKGYKLIFKSKSPIDNFNCDINSIDMIFSYE